MERDAKRPTLPLGIDFGGSRIRVALAERAADGRPVLAAVASRDVRGANPAAALGEAVAELRSVERRCVVGIGEPEATLRRCSLPSMSRRERHAAVRFEAARHVDYPLDRALLSIFPTDEGDWLVGIARKDAVAARVDAARRAGLHRPLAIDDTAFALQRLFRSDAGAIDVGQTWTRVIVFARPAPRVVTIPIGGTHLTAAIARSLGIDATSAEERKRTIGHAGAGEWQRDELVARLAGTLRAHASGAPDAASWVLTGNGARTPGFCQALAHATGWTMRMAELDAAGSALPPDVLRAAGPDWSVAFGLALWNLAQ